MPAAGQRFGGALVFRSAGILPANFAMSQDRKNAGETPVPPDSAELRICEELWGYMPVPEILPMPIPMR